MLRWAALGIALALATWLLVGRVAGRGPSAPEAPRFDADRAWAELVELVEIGPRPAGSEGAARARALIAERLRQAGLRVEEQRFEARPPGRAPVEMVNVVGVLRGEREERIVLGTHYDTKHIPGIRFVGANDGASGVAVLLEVARQLGPRPLRHTLEIAFFDGEEAFGRDITAEDGLYGSRARVEALRGAGELARVRAALVVDMVGDRDLNLAVDLHSDESLRRILREQAARIGDAGLVDERAAVSLVDDHTPFQLAGVERALAVIDFQFGARRVPGPRWHTAQDDLSAVSLESLNRVGRLVVQTLRAIDSDLARPDGAAPAGGLYPPRSEGSTIGWAPRGRDRSTS